MSLLACEILVRANKAKLAKPEVALAFHVKDQYLSLLLEVQERHKPVAEHLRDELEDLGFAW